MTDHDAFLARIKASPDDDGPRLVFADWLEERGEVERAEFIRAQIEVAKLGLPDGECPPGCPCGGLGKRAGELIRDHGDDWLPPFPSERVGDLQFDWHRGFPEKVTCDSATWLRVGDAVTAAHPVTRVRLTEPFPPEPRFGYNSAFSQEDWCGAAQGSPMAELFYNGRPFSTWTDLFAVQDELARRRHPESGLPIYYGHRGYQLELLAARWPGIAFELPAENDFPILPGELEYRGTERVGPGEYSVNFAYRPTAPGRPG